MDVELENGVKVLTLFTAQHRGIIYLEIADSPTKVQQVLAQIKKGFSLSLREIPGYEKRKLFHCKKAKDDYCYTCDLSTILTIPDDIKVRTKSVPGLQQLEAYSPKLLSRLVDLKKVDSIKKVLTQEYCIPIPDEFIPGFIETIGFLEPVHWYDARGEIEGDFYLIDTTEKYLIRKFEEYLQDGKA